MTCVGFPFSAPPNARVLILGSLPGQESLTRRQYYAKSANSFWKIMGEIAGAFPALTYEARLERLDASRIALWDVCASADRVGSLDASIDHRTVVPNDFRGFFRSQPDLQLICFNGKTAETLFRRLVSPSLSDTPLMTPTVTLPSTSPAHAGLRVVEKLRIWQAAIEPFM